MTAAPPKANTRTYGVYRPVLPVTSPGNPHRMVYTGDADGRCEIFAWDRSSGVERQLTDRPHGTLLCAIDDDEAVWWFDEDLGGSGAWRTRHFDGGPDRPALAGVPYGRPAGLALAAGGTVAVGIRTPKDSASTWGGAAVPARASCTRRVPARCATWRRAADCWRCPDRRTPPTP